MPPRHVIRRLVEEIRSVEEAAKRSDERPHFSSGIAPLDALLPGGGLRRGMLIEWLPASEEGGGASLLALLTALRIPHSAFGTLVIVDRHGTFYPPAAAAWGIPLSNLILLRATNARDEAWALDQALRSSAVAAVLAWPHRLDGRAFRRLQLAAESSGAIGILVRPASARTEPTWADVRLSVRHFRLQISDCRLESGHEVSNPRFSISGPHTASSGWHFWIDRLHVRYCMQPRDPVLIEITHEGRVHEITPAERSPTETYARSQSPIPNLKSAICNLKSHASSHPLHLVPTLAAAASDGRAAGA